MVVMVSHGLIGSQCDVLVVFDPPKRVCDVKWGSTDFGFD